MLMVSDKRMLMLGHPSGANQVGCGLLYRDAKMLGHPIGANQGGCGLLYHRRLPFDDP